MNARGFTLVEAMVAIVVLAVGVLGLAGSAAFMTRQMSGGKRLERANVIARSRVEGLSAQDCTKLSNGTANASGISEQWTVAPVTGAVTVTEQVTFAGERGARSKTYVTMLSCPANP
jgi:prepilin-type N-terminal cleavage/methylation domain-containing protein